MWKKYWDTMLLQLTNTNLFIAGQQSQMQVRSVFGSDSLAVAILNGRTAPIAAPPPLGIMPYKKKISGLNVPSGP